MRSPHAPLDSARGHWQRRRYRGRHHRDIQQPAGLAAARGGLAPAMAALARRRPAMALLMLLLAAASVSGNALGAGPDLPGVADSTGPAVAVTAGATALLQERSPGGQAVARAAERAAAVAAAPEEEPPPSEAPPEDPAEGPPPAQSRAVEPDRSPEPAEQAPGVPRTGTPPVGGLTQQQMDHAATIVATGQQEGLPEQAYVVAIATALQESNLRNLANPAWPASLNLPHDGTGYDYDSVGLFQQRPSTGWGPVDRLMDPQYAATRFYRALAQVPGWQGMAVTVAAQSVQRSAFPYHYAKHEPLAREIVDALTR